MALGPPGLSLRREYSLHGGALDLPDLRSRGVQCSQRHRLKGDPKAHPARCPLAEQEGAEPQKHCRAGEWSRSRGPRRAYVHLRCAQKCAGPLPKMGKPEPELSERLEEAEETPNPAKCGLRRGDQPSVASPWWRAKQKLGKQRVSVVVNNLT